MTAALPYRADYHLHTKWCCHATGEMRDYVEAAVARGLTEIGFAVHMPIPIPIPEKLYLSQSEMPLYVDELRRLQDNFAGRINILLGGECDYAPGQEAEIEDAIGAYPFDYVYGSIHFVDGWGHDCPEYRDRWETESVASIYRRYYELLSAAAASGYYDIIAHFDLVKKFNYQPEEDVTDAEAAACDAVAAAGMAVEISTGGFVKPVGEQYPSAKILRMLKERNVPICFGSDAHGPARVAERFDDVRRLAREIGWTTVARYKNRQRFEEPLSA
jgi:histidinol-phosphatase (PHP family)